MSTAADTQAQTDAATLVERFSLKAFVESCLVLEEGVATIRDIDLAMMTGFGILPGPFARADDRGLDDVLAALDRAQAEWGEHFAPPLRVDANFVKLMKILLKSGTYHGIATHDPKMIDATIAFARKEKTAADSFEFQMLYGVRRDLQQQLVRDGWRMRVYIPFGTEWYPYLMRRLAERPANAIFILKNVLRR